MIIATTRFGPVEVQEDRLLHFVDGLVGFPTRQRYALIETGPQSGFYWLQSVDEATLAFVVTDPRLFVPEYTVAIRAEDGLRLGAGPDDCLQLFAIVNKVDQVLTANLQGPLLVNPANLRAVQLVLSEKRHTTRHPLLRLPAKAASLCRSA
jgi:flagellar assembly factor FliW